MTFLEKNDLTRLYSRLAIFTKLRRYISAQHLTVLVYHEIAPSLFAAHVNYLQGYYTIVPLSTVREAVATESTSKLPPHSLAITFDDGWKSNYHLLPVLKHYDIPITIFVACGLIDTHRVIWNYALDRSHEDENRWLKSISNLQKDIYLRSTYGHYPEKEYPQRSMLNRSEFEAMRPYVNFQSHGMFHPVLTQCSDSELIFELTESKQRLADLTGTEVYALAYPYGKAGPREHAAARAAGYEVCRVSGVPRLNPRTNLSMPLVAITIGADSSVADLKMQIARGHVRAFLPLS